MKKLPKQFRELSEKLRGEVRTGEIDRHLLATDGSYFQRLPMAVVFPADASDVARTVRFAARHRVAVHPRGAGSGLTGGALGNGIVLDFTRYMNRLLNLDRENRRFTCQPGYRLGELEVELAGSGLFFPPDPSSGEYATFGGMCATNASGSHSVKYGSTVDYLQDAEVVLASGDLLRIGDVREAEIHRLPDPLRRLAALYDRHAEAIESGYPPVRFNSAGYNLRGLVKAGRLNLQRLLSGSEGTLAVSTRLTFRLLEKPAHDSLVVAFFDDMRRSARAVQRILPLGPSGIEMMDKSLLALARRESRVLARKIPAGVDNVLMVEFDGPEAALCRQAAEAVLRLLATEGLCDEAHLAVSDAEKARFWAVRKAAVPILYKLKGRKRILALVEDAAVPTERLEEYVAGIYALMARRGVEFVTYGHIAKGLLHTRPLLDLKSGRDVDLLRVLADEVFELVRGLGGTVSGEHGDGRLRSAYVRRQYPRIHHLFGRVKQLLDPDGRFNPAIITHHDPRQMASNLRFGADYRRRSMGRDRLRWPEGFAAAVENCHGCAKCTTVTTATRMCPVYKFTRDEHATPRAKANVLRALISGAVESRELYSRAARAVISRCVNCGSCLAECPSNVNIPKMALEARSRYVERFGPTRADLLTAHVEAAARATRKVSPLLAAIMARPLARRAGEVLTGVSAERDFIPFARRSLFERLPTVLGEGRLNVLYFAGCYAGYIRPEIGIAAIRVLTRLGCRVHLPPQHCCGLPLLSKGMAPAAAGRVQANLAAWRNLLPAVDRIVVTCSSCGLTLRQEWHDLPVASPAVSQVGGKLIHFSRLVNERLAAHRVEPRPGRIAYHLPCHLKAQPESDSSLELLSRLPQLETIDLAGHCCGMAGSWGLQARNESLSRSIGTDLIGRIERSGASVVATDCPTCRIQIEQLGTLPVRHPAEILAACLPPSTA